MPFWFAPLRVAPRAKPDRLNGSRDWSGAESAMDHRRVIAAETHGLDRARPGVTCHEGVLGSTSAPPVWRAHGEVVGSVSSSAQRSRMMLFDASRKCPYVGKIRESPCLSAAEHFQTSIELRLPLFEAVTFQSGIASGNSNLGSVRKSSFSLVRRILYDLLTRRRNAGCANADVRRSSVIAQVPSAD